jgi:DNA-binding CsgD family transcriptional regulator
MFGRGVIDAASSTTGCNAAAAGDRDGGVAIVTNGGEGMDGSGRLAWPLTGRSEEMRLIKAAMLDPDSSGIVVSGAAGVGKSRMAREALAALTGCEVRWVVATSAARSVPLGAFASWAGRAGSDSLRLVGDVIEALTSAPAGTEVVVGVDDVHLLDDLSTFVLHQIVQRGAAKVVLTVRDGEPVPAATQELWRESQLEWLDLQALSRGEIVGLVSAALGGPVDPAAAQRLWDLTLGNVLYLRNIVEQEVADKRLAIQQGLWRWIGEPAVAPGLVQLIESRIGSLPAEVSDVIDALAVGEPIELALLSRITGSAAVEQADERGLITLEPVDGGMEVRLAHPLYGEVRRRRAPRTRLRRLRGLVATELAESDDRDAMQVVVRCATLSLDSDRKPDADRLVRAARGAVWLMDLPLADRLADAAIRAGGQAEAHFVRAHVLSWLSRGEEADAVLADIPTSGLTDTDRSRLAFLRAVNRFFTLADPAGAKQLIDDAADTAPPRARSCIDAFLTVYWAAMGNPQAASESAKTFTYDQLPDDVAARLATWAITLAAGEAGRTTEAGAAAEASTHIPIRSFVVITDAHLGALLLSGRISDAQHAAEFLRGRARELPGTAANQVMGANVAVVAGRAAIGAGSLDAASALLDPAAEALSASGEANGWAYRCQLPRTIALAMRGLISEATHALALLERQRHPGWRYLDYEYAVAHAWVAASQGATSQAIKTLLSAAETARANGQFAAEVLCLQTATQFGDGSTASRLRELEAIVEGPRVGIAARFAAAMSAGDAAELTAVSTDFEQMGDIVAAIDAAAHAAAAYRSQGLRGSALGSANRAGALAEQCGASGSPALRQVIEPLPFTGREHEVIMLMARGLSNREIAERLTLSVRTVESHIYHAMAKTGTTSREDLAALVRKQERAG